MKIQIVMSVSNKFVNYFLVAVWSFMKYISKEILVHLTLLYCELSYEEIDRIHCTINKWNNLTVDLVNVIPYAEKYGLNYSDIKDIPTCFPLLADEILPSIDKIICLDSDIIVKRDLTNLWNVSLNDKLIAAVPDLDFLGQIISGNNKLAKYYKSIDPELDYYEYIQGGIVVLNLVELRKSFKRGELFTYAVKGHFKYDDQDVLSIKCKRRILFLDMRWNVLHNNLNYRVPYIISFVPKEKWDEYKSAREEPWIIHYAGCQKPWDDKTCDYADAFWKVAKETPVYNLLECNYSLKHNTLKNNIVKKAGRYLRFVFRKIRYSIRNRYKKVD